MSEEPKKSFEELSQLYIKGVREINGPFDEIKIRENEKRTILFRDIQRTAKRRLGIINIDLEQMPSSKPFVERILASKSLFDREETAYTIDLDYVSVTNMTAKNQLQYWVTIHQPGMLTAKMVFDDQGVLLQSSLPAGHIKTITGLRELQANIASWEEREILGKSDTTLV